MSGTGSPVLPRRMRAAVLHGRGDLRVEEVPVPAPGPGEVLLRTGTVGLCGTDAAEWSGPAMMPVLRAHPVTGHRGPLVIGHEFSGVVVDTGAGVDRGLAGRLLASCGAVSCGRCWQCARGRTNMCESYSAVGLHRHGAAAGYVTVPVDSCEPADQLGLGPDGAALGQPMSIALHASRRGRVAAGERVVLLGTGGIGAFLAYALARTGATVLAVDPDARRRELAVTLGAAAAVGPDELPAAAGAALGGPPHAVFEASGSAPGLAAALDLLPGGGRLVVVGMQKVPASLDLRRLALRELELIGTNAMNRHPDFTDALRLVAGRAAGWADVAPTALPLDAVVAGGLEPLAAGRAPAVKILVDPWAGAERPTDTVPRPGAGPDGRSQPWPTT
jgi:(R,R)-butanediol dehydrogenase / meso-butanediol dehydrogenase / diacetyl reductase